MSNSQKKLATWTFWSTPKRTFCGFEFQGFIFYFSLSSLGERGSNLFACFTSFITQAVVPAPTPPPPQHEGRTPHHLRHFQHPPLALDEINVHVHERSGTRTLWHDGAAISSLRHDGSHYFLTHKMFPFICKGNGCWHFAVQCLHSSSYGTGTWLNLLKLYAWIVLTEKKKKKKTYLSPTANSTRDRKVMCFVKERSNRERFLQFLRQTSHSRWFRELDCVRMQQCNGQQGVEWVILRVLMIATLHSDHIDCRSVRNLYKNPFNRKQHIQ